ncbi:glutamate-tRNA ligase [Dacryopinax primogenitus]|uniref:glutamate--tRNA ligase n=1 Tax=Dacryopinax primogenitus (strain DJM 731) TaxID=1858805 RepID=M5GGC9_DACPD|nr:glutamate-tRNA ligase [Dacryopinax primogenitus]EJU05268.1 glutamate-tRNA ligase [Dacryopinax primogenitus]
MTTLYVNSKDAPFPFGVLALAAVSGVEYVFDDEQRHSVELISPMGEVRGVEESIRALADQVSAWGEKSPTEAFLAQAVALSTLTAFAAVTSSIDALDDRLALRTYLSGHEPTVADYAIWGALKRNNVVAGVLKRGAHVHLARWIAHLEGFERVQSALAALTEARSSKNKSAKKAAAASSFALGLPDAAEGKVVTRFPPEPSGYLHIGHAKAAMLNQYFAQMYKGRLIIRFDDTNPSKEKEEFEQSIIEDLALLGVHADLLSHTSDWFAKLYEECVELIKRGKAYADDTEQEQMRCERTERLPSKRRDMTPEETLQKFEEMKTGSVEGQRWCIRAKISYNDDNGALRDPVIYRCNLTPHHRTGSQWKVYPTYDFACPIVDCLEGVTHALRTNEYRDRNPQYHWFLQALGMRDVHVWDFSRIAFIYTLLSKRKLHWFVDQGLVGGWDDPRFPTVRGIRRRGMTVEGLKQFILAQGPSQSQLLLEWDTIWSLNKKVIDPVAPRFWAIMKDNAVKVTIRGAPGVEVKNVPKHKKNSEVGEKKTVYSGEIYVEQEDAVIFEDNEEITLMDWGNAIVRSKETGPNGVITHITMDLHLEGDFKKTEKKITWLTSPTAAHPLVNVVLKDYDYLITKKKLEEEDKVQDFVTPVTEFKVAAWSDANVLDLAKGDIIQFERKGYYILDNISGAKGEETLEFIHIPDGKAAGVASKAEQPVEEEKPAKAKKQPKGTPPCTTDAARPKKEKKAAAAPGSAAPIVDGAAGPVPGAGQPDDLRTVKSDGDIGFDIQVPTGMFAVKPIYGEKAVPLQPGSNMFEVKPIYEH